MLFQCETCKAEMAWHPSPEQQKMIESDPSYGLILMCPDCIEAFKKFMKSIIRKPE